MLIAANAQLARRRRGRLLGLLSFPASAAKYDRAEFDGFTATRWGGTVQLVVLILRLIVFKLLVMLAPFHRAYTY